MHLVWCSRHSTPAFFFCNNVAHFVASCQGRTKGGHKDLTKAEGSVDFLNKAMTKAEETAARVQADMERLKSVHRTTERNVLKEEKSQLEKENQALRYMVVTLEA
ncbi:hypothetical protein LWI29_035612 [Acer saccharum]|uniref:Uncharacterized protein n=1 Tax=Acer saccharum TaxID=4024 RepID=A0AA39SPM8_ACESA|nr:hypothetical protein LWI29_035612 [Acer saccharum]